MKSISDSANFRSKFAHATVPSDIAPGKEEAMSETESVTEDQMSADKNSTARH